MKYRFGEVLSGECEVKPLRLEVLQAERSLLWTELPVLISLNSQSQQIHGPFQVLLFQYVRNSDFIHAFSRCGVEGTARGKHHGVTVVVEVCQQPLLEGVGIVYRQRRP